jgi:hypothetical protein
MAEESRPAIRAVTRQVRRTVATPSRRANPEKQTFRGHPVEDAGLREHQPVQRADG